MSSTRRTLLGASALAAPVFTFGSARLLGGLAGASVSGQHAALPLVDWASPPATAAPAAAEAAAPAVTDAAAAGALRIPPLLSALERDRPNVFQLTLQPGQSQFLPDRITATLGINGSYLGPTLRARWGDAVIANVINRIGEATTVHWHGMHLPPVMDGGPHQVIEANSTWSPRFVIKQQAATLWYHPHLMGATCNLLSARHLRADLARAAG